MFFLHAEKFVCVARSCTRMMDEKLVNFESNNRCFCNSPMSKLQGRSGFLLLETCLSMVLLAMMGCIMSSWLATLTQVEEDTVQRIKALMMARSAIEKYKAFNKVPTGAKKRGVTVSLHNRNDSSEPNRRAITVTVTYGRKEMEKQYILNAIMAERINSYAC